MYVCMYVCVNVRLYLYSQINRYIDIETVFSSCAQQRPKLQVFFAKEPYQRDYILLLVCPTTTLRLLRSYYLCMYGEASISRLLTIIGLFCRISSLLQGSFAKETHNFKELTNRSHPITNVCMGWLRLVGSLQLQVSFAECRLFYRALLQRRPIILRSLLIVATP